MSQAGIINVVTSNPNIPIYFDADTGSATAIFNVINIVGAGGITTSATLNTITIDGSAIISNLTLTGDSGGPLSPTLDNFNIVGGSVVAGSIPLQVNGLASTLTVNVQRSQSLVAPDSTKVGLCNFDSSDFSVDVNGFVSLSTTGALETLTGNSGGAISPIASNIDINTAGSTVKFVGTPGILTQDFALSNLLQGSSGSSITTAVRSSSYGLNALLALTSGNDNTALGVGALQATTVNSNSTAVGSGALQGATGGNSTAVGYQTLFNMTGSANVAMGHQSLISLLTGTNNLALGYQSGINYTGGESSNVLLTNAGTVGESGKIRLGTPGVQNAFFAAGIDGVNIGSVATVVTESGDQLGTAVITAGTGISITPGANTITISSTAGGFTWSDISGAFSPLSQNGYFITATATGTLPASPSNGDTINFFVDHASQVLTIQATGTQIIRMGTVVSAAAGSAVSTQRGDSVELVYRSTNTSWQAVDFVGTWIVS